MQFMIEYTVIDNDTGKSACNAKNGSAGHVYRLCISIYIYNIFRYRYIDIYTYIDICI